jgi:hypothetical protein
MIDPKPHPFYGERWSSWVGARHEYLKRAINSRSQPEHISPEDLVAMPTVVVRCAEQYIAQVFGGRADDYIYRRLKVQEITHFKRAVLKMRAVLRDYYALRTRDKERSCNTRLTFAFDDVAKRVKHTRLRIKRDALYDRRLSANGAVHIAIRPAHRSRHDELVFLMWEKLIKREDVAATNGDTKGDDDWMQYVPGAEFLVEKLPKENEEKEKAIEKEIEDDPHQGGKVIKTSVARVTAMKEPVIRPIERVPQDKAYWQAPEYSVWAVNHPVKGWYLLEKMITASQRRDQRMEQMRSRMEALKLGRMGRRDKVRERFIGPLQAPTKSEGQYKPTPFAALVWGNPSTKEMLLRKKVETDEYLLRVGGVCTFTQSESGLYLPPPSDFDEDLKF